jgi:electron transfer flavoprotein alpha subunit
MDNSELIIAINSDEQAPIFNKAHYGVVGDMFQILSALTSRLQGKS